MPTEVVALYQLRVRALKKEWTTEESFPEITPSIEGGPFRSTADAASFKLNASLVDVKKVLAKALKPGREMVSVVRFANGQIHEATDAATEALLGTVHDNIANAKRHEVDMASVPPRGAEVASPIRGCPEPNFKKAELRANGVLEAFLNSDQVEDFRRYNRFVTRGSMTGHNYMVTSRHATDSLAKYRRSLYDLDENMPYCVHDYSVPAPEEMLALHALLQIPSRELYLRHLDV